jgi:2-isopropylmalate synthase
VIDDKIRILHLIDTLGIETADVGLPGAGAHVAADVERLVREIVSAKLPRAPQLRGPRSSPTSNRSSRSRSVPDSRSSAARSSGRASIRQYAED